VVRAAAATVGEEGMAEEKETGEGAEGW